MSAFTDLLQNPTLAGVRALVLGYAQAAGLPISDWGVGGVGQQEFEAYTDSQYNATNVYAATIRGFASLDTSTDPGDPDPYDPAQASRPPAPGFLSNLGANTFGTDRIGATFASGFMTITNPSASPEFTSPQALTFTRSTPDPVTGLPVTYRNVADPTVYTNPDGTVTIPAGGTKIVPVAAEVIGTTGNASSGTVSLSTTLGLCTATNATAILGTEREGADAYRERCRLAPASVSPNGPADAYRYIALSAQKNATTGDIFYFLPGSTTGLGVDSNGNQIQIPNAVGTPLGVTRVQVSNDSTTGNVIVFFATAAGAPSGGVVADLKSLFDAVYWPDCTTRTFLPAVEVAITIDGAVKARAGAGVSTTSLANAIDSALSAAFPTYEIGGFNQTAGAGTIYQNELSATVNGASVAIYSVTLSSPSGNTALALGEVATLTNNITSGDITITST